MTAPATSEPELRCTKCGSADIHTRNLLIIGLLWGASLPR